MVISSIVMLVLAPYTEKNWEAENKIISLFVVPLGIEPSGSGWSRNTCGPAWDRTKCLLFIRQPLCQ